MAANDREVGQVTDRTDTVRQEGGSHYNTDNGIQHWDWAENLAYLEGCATKYIGRHDEKGGLGDIKKGLTFIAKIVLRHYGLKLTWSIEEK